ncbi:hypothetical protein FDF84_06500, partial [Clostridium botulinum]|nr:hypothetical protein [Clostridium botulinum]
MVNRYSNFPSQIDKLKTLPEFQEISVKQWKSFSKWNELISKGSNMTENDINELNRLLKSDLRDVQITSTDWNKLCASVTNLEDYIINHIFPDISKMINEKEKEFTAIVTKKTQEFNIKIDNFVDKGIYNNDTHYNKNNFIHYDDGTGLKIYIALKDTQGVSPSDDGIVWRLLTIKGDKGDNGQDGLNLVFKGGWNPSTNYKFGQVTSYNGSVFVSMQDDNLNNIPNENIDTEYWAKWKQVSITTTKLKGIRKVINPTNKIKFIGCGDITVFNPHIDDLEVCKNNLILVENLQYKINEDNQTIDSLEGDWNASADSPNIFEFRVVRNQINNLTFSDGQTIQDKTITKNKLSTDVQNEINSIKTLNEEVENLKSHVDNGKSSLYSAIVGKKATPRSKDFADLVEGIKNIKLGQGTAQASEVLEGRTFTNDTGLMQTGTMPNMGSKEIIPKPYTQELGKGCYSGIKVKGINDL